jgi:hypothetical protein
LKISYNRLRKEWANSVMQLMHIVAKAKMPK